MPEANTSEFIATDAGGEAPQEPTRALLLRLVGTQYDGQLLRFDRNKLTIGSSVGCSLVLRSNLVSPIHCFLVRGPAGLLMTSMSEGTRVNGVAENSSWLGTGDHLSIGHVDLEVLDTGIGEEPHTPTQDNNDSDSEVTSADQCGTAFLEQVRDSLQSQVDELVGELRDTRQKLELLQRQAAGFVSHSESSHEEDSRLTESQDVSACDSLIASIENEDSPDTKHPVTVATEESHDAEVESLPLSLGVEPSDSLTASDETINLPLGDDSTGQCEKKGERSQNESNLQSEGQVASSQCGETPSIDEPSREALSETLEANVSQDSADPTTAMGAAQQSLESLTGNLNDLLNQDQNENLQPGSLLSAFTETQGETDSSVADSISADHMEQESAPQEQDSFTSIDSATPVESPEAVANSPRELENGPVTPSLEIDACGTDAQDAEIAHAEVNESKTQVTNENTESPEEEDSINAYMSDLLSRLRGDREDEPESETTDNKVDSRNEARIETEKLLKNAFRSELSEREKELAPVEYVKREAPEKPQSLKTLRDVANSTARSALDTSRRRKQTLPFAGALAGSIGSLVLGSYLLFTGVSTLGGATLLLVGVGLGAVGGWLKVKLDREIKADEAAAEAESLTQFDEP